MSIDFSQIENLPTLPAVLRETPNVSKQVSEEMKTLDAVCAAAVENLIRTPEGENTNRAGTTYIGAIGGTIREAFKPIAGALALHVNATERSTPNVSRGQGNSRG